MNRDRAEKVLMGAFAKVRADYLTEIESINPVDPEGLQMVSAKLWVLREIRHDVEQAIQEIEEG